MSLKILKQFEERKIMTEKDFVHQYILHEHKFSDLDIKIAIYEAKEIYAKIDKLYENDIKTKIEQQFEINFKIGK
jgi:hypothetical protein